MDNKKSFLIYYDYEDQLADLSDEELGVLVRALFRYEKSQEEPNFKGLLKMAFAFIKGNLDRDRQKYDRRSETSKINGQKGGRPPLKKPSSKPNSKPKKPKEAVIETETDIEIDKDIVTDEIIKRIELTDFDWLSEEE